MNRPDSDFKKISLKGGKISVFLKVSQIHDCYKPSESSFFVAEALPNQTSNKKRNQNDVFSVGQRDLHL